MDNIACKIPKDQLKDNKLSVKKLKEIHRKQTGIFTRAGYRGSYKYRVGIWEKNTEEISGELWRELSETDLIDFSYKPLLEFVLVRHS